MSEEPADYALITEAGLNRIDRVDRTKRGGISQRLFRGNLLRLWQGSCAVTQVQEPRVSRSSEPRTVTFLRMTSPPLLCIIARGEGLQFRLWRIKNPIIRRRNL